MCCVYVHVHKQNRARARVCVSLLHNNDKQNRKSKGYRELGHVHVYVCKIVQRRG